jgi:protein involved in polysaccharide export with SLBB domain
MRKRKRLRALVILSGLLLLLCSEQALTRAQQSAVDSRSSASNAKCQLPVSVTGEARAAGLFHLRRRVRLSELLRLASGFTEQAGETIRVEHAISASTCDEPDAGSSDASSSNFEIVNLVDILRGDEKSDPYLRPGDAVTVSHAGRVRVNGNVARPGWVFHRMALTLSQAVALAGGYLPGSKTDKIIITRHRPGAASVVFEVNLKAIRKRRAPDVFLEPNDIVHVPGKRANGCSAGAHVFVVFLSVNRPTARVID